MLLGNGRAGQAMPGALGMEDLSLARPAGLPELPPEPLPSPAAFPSQQRSLGSQSQPRGAVLDVLSSGKEGIMFLKLIAGKSPGREQGLQGAFGLCYTILLPSSSGSFPFIPAPASLVLFCL